jgi:hypothetical protein
MEAFEGPLGSRIDTLDNVMAALEKAGIGFLDNDQPGVRQRKK